MIRRSLLTLATLATFTAVTFATPRVASAGATTYQSCTAAAVMTSFASYVGCSGSFPTYYGSEADGLAMLSASAYTFAGSSLDANAGPFQSNPSGASGFLQLDAAIPLGTNFVVVVKSSESFALYAFNGSNGGTDIPYAAIASGYGGTINGSAYFSSAKLYVGPAALVDVSTVPEPSTYALMSAGLVALGLVSRRRRKA